MAKASAGTPAVRVLEAAGTSFVLHAYDYRGERGAIGLEAAQHLNVDPARVLKTLVAEVDGRAVMAIVPVPCELDLKALARAGGGKRAWMADIKKAERQTGYVKGGISPLGQRQRLAAFIDGSAGTHETVFVSGGRRGLELELAPADLARLLDAVSADISR